MKAKKKAVKKHTAAVPVPGEKVLVLRTCDAKMQSYDGFQWPQSGTVEAPDWKKTAECGNGLHGWLWGSGDWSLKAKGDAINWLVLEVEKASIIDLTGKVKFPKCEVLGVFGAWNDAMKFIRAKHPADDSTTIATGDYGHASATGDSGHASATGNSGHASATGNSGHASATGEYGHASATGNFGHASATGNSGWAVCGYNGDAKADKNGVITGIYFDDKAKRPRVLVGYVGEDGIEANVSYHIEDGKWVRNITGRA